MTTAMITQRGTIRARHSVREDFAGVTTRDGRERYFDTKGHAVRDYEKVLNDYGLCFDPNDFMQMPGDDGRITVDIWSGFVFDDDDDTSAGCVGCALIMWYRMENSGRYEFTGYIA